MKLSNPEHPLRSRSARRRAAVLLAAAASVSLVLAGCSGNAGSDKVTLSYAIWDAPQKPAMQKIVDEFEKQNPNIQVKIQVTPWDTYWTKLQTAATGGSAPDVFWMNDANLPNYANGGAIMSLQSRIDADKIDMSNYVQAQVKADSWDGKVFGIPKDVDAIGLWYNKKLFARRRSSGSHRGLDPAGSHHGGEEADRSGEGRVRHRSPGCGTAELLFDDPAGRRLRHFSGRDGSPATTRPRRSRASQFWIDMINKYHVSPTLQQMTDTDPRRCSRRARSR